MESANKRIAQNTIFMYIRLFTTMVIGLYTSRLVLEIIGVSDYGLFAVVGGVLGLFTFISGSLAQATSRFFNTEMGKKDGDVNVSFNINLVLHTCLAIIIFFLAETIGLWYVCNYLNIPEGKYEDAIFVYQISIITACLGVINGPYRSLFDAHERFKFTAILDIVNSIIRLLAILMLYVLPSDGLQLTPLFTLSLLKLYTLIYALTTVNTFIVFHLVSLREWPQIVKRKFIKRWTKYSEVLTFSGWNLFATLAYMSRSSGSDILLNMFFGTTVNGAFAISKTISNITSEFATKFDGTSAPQIVQAYAANDKERYTYLANKIGRINILLFVIICFPALIELEFVLRMWLGTVPEGAVEFTYINILVSGIALTSGGAINVINASGRIKWFKINVSFFFLMCVPVGWFLFYLGYSPYSLLVLYLIADVIQRVIQLVLMQRILHFDSWRYVREAYLPPLKVVFVMTIILYFYSMLGISSTAFKILSIVICFCFTFLLVLFMGLTNGERSTLKKTFRDFKFKY